MNKYRNKKLSNRMILLVQKKEGKEQLLGNNKLLFIVLICKILEKIYIVKEKGGGIIFM